MDHEIDTSIFHDHYNNDDTGRLPYDPRKAMIGGEPAFQFCGYIHQCMLQMMKDKIGHFKLLERVR
ncbi:hypothetical protein [Parendozoicomonas sp. Alg238-R29]|uniref:hypothetical protein n=1 Tax=Parendozoicomonas sp. Alg238-R29 TaxID=2993446 RepID=UPI00248DD167|nr:hypothetical protein [Parendozoicomonas sp. Alg238-R29]